MEQMKTKRIQRERKVLAIHALRAYKISALPWNDVMPEPMDFCAFPEIESMLELPNDANVDESAFMDMRPEFPSIFDRWRSSIHRLLIDRFRKAQKDQLFLAEVVGVKCFTNNISPEASDEDVIFTMRLATTVFKCLACDYVFVEDDKMVACRGFDSRPDHTSPLFYPQILGHRCLMVKSDYTVEPSPDPSVRLDPSDFMERCRRQWTCLCLVVDSRAGKVAEGIIVACGLEPSLTTAEEMDCLDARLTCLNCATQYSNGTVADAYGWRSAVSAIQPSSNEFQLTSVTCRYTINATTTPRMKSLG